MRRVSALALAAVATIFLPACEGGETQTIVPYATEDRQIDTGAEGNAVHPRMCVAGTTVYVVWQEDRGSGNNQVLFTAGRAGGAVWDEPIQISTNPTGDAIAESPELACLGDSVYVVYEDDRDSEIGHRNVYFRYSDDTGRTWQTEQLLSGDVKGDWDALGPQIEVDQDLNGIDKRLYVTWYDNRFGAYDIYVNAGTNGYNWQVSEQRIDTDTPGSSYSAHPKLASDGIGGAYVVWEDSRGGSNSVYYNHSFDWGTNWQASDLRLDGGTAAGSSDAFGVQITIDRDRTNPPQPAVYVAWHDDRNGPKDIYLNRSLDAGFNWDDTPARIDNDAPGSANSFYPALSAVDDRVLVTWHDDRDIGFDIYLRSSDDAGASWLSETRVDAGIAGSAHSLDSRVQRVGDRVAVGWTDYRTPVELGSQGHPDVYYRLSDDAGYLFADTDERVDDDPAATAISEDLQMVMSGPSVHMVWVDYRLGNADLWYRAMPSFIQPD